MLKILWFSQDFCFWDQEIPTCHAVLADCQGAALLFRGVALINLENLSICPSIHPSIYLCPSTLNDGFIGTWLEWAIACNSDLTGRGHHKWWLMQGIIPKSQDDDGEFDDIQDDPRHNFKKKKKHKIRNPKWWLFHYFSLETFMSWFSSFCGSDPE